MDGMDAGMLQLTRALHALHRSAAAVLADQLSPTGSRPLPEWGPLAGEAQIENVVVSAPKQCDQDAPSWRHAWRCVPRRITPATDCRQLQQTSAKHLSADVCVVTTCALPLLEPTAEVL